jgi:hypothetical protein
LQNNNEQQDWMEKLGNQITANCKQIILNISEQARVILSFENLGENRVSRKSHGNQFTHR